MIVQPATQHIPYYFVRCGRRTWRVSKAREPRLSVGRDCGTVQPVASDYRTDWARRTRRSRLLCTDRLWEISNPRRHPPCPHRRRTTDSNQPRHSGRRAERV